MKRTVMIILVTVLIFAAAYLWCVINDPFSLSHEHVALIEYTHTEELYNDQGIRTSERINFTITDENHIRYLTDYLNNILPIPGKTSNVYFDRVLSFRGHDGNILTQVTIPNHESIITEHGTFLADMSELNNNLSSIEEGKNIYTNMMALPFYLICYLVVAVLGGLLALAIFLFQMGVCSQTDIIIVRLISSVLSLVAIHYFDYIFYILLLFGIQQWNVIYFTISAVCIISMVLGWRKGHQMWKEKVNISQTNRGIS